MALGLPVNQMEKQLAFCDVQRHFALWKTFRGIAITLPGIAITLPTILIVNVHPSVGENPPRLTTAYPFAPEALYELEFYAKN